MLNNMSLFKTKKHNIPLLCQCDLTIRYDDKLKKS